MTFSDYIQCPYCQRRFSENAADRHIKFCKEQASRISNKSKVPGSEKAKPPARIPVRFHSLWTFLGISQWFICLFSVENKQCLEWVDINIACSCVCSTNLHHKRRQTLPLYLLCPLVYLSAQPMGRVLAQVWLLLLHPSMFS